MILRLLILGIALLLTACAGQAAPTATAVPPSPTLTPSPATATLSPTATNLPPTATMMATAVPPTATTVPATDLRYLQAAIEQALADFPGLSSVYVTDLKSGATLQMDSDLAIAGMSLIKIPILVETYRTLDAPPNIEQNKLISETMGIDSGNYTANLLLHEIAGEENTFVGADVLTASMKELGLFNTFIAVPYDAELPEGRLPTYLTPANQRTDLTTFPDPYRQTTIGDIGRLLEMVYQCGQENSGPLRELTAKEITQAECNEVLTVMKRLELGAFIEEGLPEGTAVAHKHGWIDDTHGDAGVVFTPGGDYVLGVALYESEWLEWETSSAIIAEISRLAYAHFNDPQVYEGVELPPPTATPEGGATALPDLPRAIISGTQGIGLTVRDAPGGAEVAILPDGTILAMLPTEPVEFNGYRWFAVLLPDGREAWAAEDFFTPWK